MSKETKLGLLKSILKRMKIDINNIKVNDIDNVEIDSRKCKENSLFFAINSGNDYVITAARKGALVICDDKKYLNCNVDNVVVVDNTVLFMQKFAKLWRKRLSDVLFIGITGSNGKTSVKDIMSKLLTQMGKVNSTKGNYNNHIGVPLTILNTEYEHDFAVIEMGISHKGDMKVLADMVIPNFSIITNIGTSHIGFLGDEYSILEEKSVIIEYTLQEVFVNSKDKLLSLLYSDVYHCETDNLVNTVYYKNNKMHFTIELFENSRINVITNLLGKHYITNIALCLEAMIEIFKLKIEEVEDIVKVLENIEITPMRMQILELEHTGLTVINDAYNSSKSSAISALETMNSMFPKSTKCVVFGSMLELGEKSTEIHLSMIDHFLANNIEYLILYGAETREIAKRIYDERLPINMVYIDISEDTILDHYGISKNENFKIIYSKNELNELKKNSEYGTIAGYILEILRTNPDLVLLLKGSRGMHLENILKELN